MTKSQAILALAVSGTVLLVFLWKLLQLAYRIARRFEEVLGVDQHGKTLRGDVNELKEVVIGDDDAPNLRDDVNELKKALGNGIRDDVRRALELAEGNAAGIARVEASASRSEVSADDARRATNQLRGELNIIADSVIDDRARVWKILASMGYDRRASEDDRRA